MNQVQEYVALIRSARFKKVKAHCLNCKRLKLGKARGYPYDAFCASQSLWFICEERKKFNRLFAEIIESCKRRKLFIVSVALVFLLYFPAQTSETFHHAFDNWKEYSYYFERTASHGVSGAERVFEKGKVTYYFINKREKRCVL